jgi:predicted ATPase
MWAELVRALAKDRGDEALLAKVAPLLAGVADPSEAAQFALFDAVTRSFREASQARPLVVVLDDLHWADEPSLRLLEFFAREIRKGAILLIGTYRDSGLQREPNGHAIGGLIGQANSLSVPLRSFSLDEIARLVELSGGTPPSTAFTKAVFERSGGNPLYAEQLLKTDWAERAMLAAAHEMTSTMDLQQGLIETICRHLETMTEAGREVLTLAAVLGREFPLGKLGVVSGLASEALLDRLDEAVRANFVLQPKEGLFRFAHVLVRDVLYKRLSSAERAQRHRVVGEALLAHYGDAIEPHVGELADHFARALPGGDLERAIDLATRAAEQAGGLGRHREAAKHWQQAAHAFALLPHNDARRVAVQLGLARARLAADQRDDARDSFLDAAILARTFARAGDLAEAALAYAGLASDVAQRRSLLEQALAALDEPADAKASGLKARVATALSKGPAR